MSSWASIVRGSAKVMPSVSVEKKEGKVFFHPFCSDCSHAAEVCSDCRQNGVFQEEYKSKKPLCSRCLVSRLDSESMCIGYIYLSENAEKIPFKCRECRLKSPWAYNQFTEKKH